MLSSDRLRDKLLKLYSFNSDTVKGRDNNDFFRISEMLHLQKGKGMA